MCSLKKCHANELQLAFEAGSIETLLNIVGINQGMTAIPELVLPTLSPTRIQQILPFVSPEPVREISLLTYRHFMKDKLLQVIIKEIQDGIALFLQL